MRFLRKKADNAVPAEKAEKPKKNRKTENRPDGPCGRGGQTTTLIQGTGSNYKSKAVLINESAIGT